MLRGQTESKIYIYLPKVCSEENELLKKFGEEINWGKRATEGGVGTKV